MKPQNLLLALKDQLPISRLIRNIIKGHLFGLIHRRSHLNAKGELKVTYRSKTSAQKAALKMREKYGFYYSNYKCVFCDGYHIGRNSENKNPIK